MGQAFSVRPMGAGDISAAAAIEATVPDGWSGQAIAEYAAMPAARCFVAVSGQQVCGLAAFTCAAGEANLDAARPGDGMCVSGSAHPKRACTRFVPFARVYTNRNSKRVLYKSERRRHFDEAAA